MASHGDPSSRQDAVEHRLGADRHPADRGHLVAATGDGDDRAAGRPLELLPQPRHAGAQVGEARRAADLADRRALGSATAAGELPVVGESDRRIASNW